MEDLQGALQSILSDPEQMARVASLAESLGLKPPEPAGTPLDAHSGQSEESVSPSFPGLDGLDLGKLMGQLSALNGAEDRVLGALRPTLSQSGQGKVDRALRAAKLSRLAGQFLTQGRNGHV